MSNIKFYSGDIFDVRRWFCQFGQRATRIPIVVPVNTVGVPGAGMATAWADIDPRAASIYKKICADNLLDTGVVWTINSLHQWILFPTKTAWRMPSKLEYIETGLAALKEEIELIKPAAVAIPLLGCGLGGLVEADVIRLLYASARKIPDVAVLIFKHNEKGVKLNHAG